MAMIHAMSAKYDNIVQHYGCQAMDQIKIAFIAMANTYHHGIRQEDITIYSDI